MITSAVGYKYITILEIPAGYRRFLDLKLLTKKWSNVKYVGINVAEITNNTNLDHLFQFVFRDFSVPPPTSRKHSYL